jgi:hypothetical protein
MASSMLSEVRVHSGIGHPLSPEAEAETLSFAPTVKSSLNSSPPLALDRDFGVTYAFVQSVDSPQLHVPSEFSGFPNCFLEDFSGVIHFWAALP